MTNPQPRPELHHHDRPIPFPPSRSEQVAKPLYHAIRPAMKFKTPVPHACGHDAEVRLKFLDRPRPFELTAASRRAAAAARYRVCASCSASARAEGAVARELGAALGVEIERLEGRGAGVDEHALGDVIARVVGLRDHLVAVGDGSPTARALLDSWARVAVARLEPTERGRLLFAVLMERGDDDVQWVSEGLARAAAAAASS